MPPNAPGSSQAQGSQGQSSNAPGANAQGQRTASAQQGSAQGNKARPANVGGPGGSNASSSAPSQGGERSAAASAARRPSGAYPAPSDQSMRPRTEADPEPGDLFRPSSDQAKSGGAEPKPGAEHPGGVRTALVPTIQPPPASAQRPSEGQSNRAGNEANAMVNPARPAQGAHPDSARPEQKKDAPNEPGEAARQGPGQGNGPGAGGAERVDRSPSASRSG